MARPLCLSAFQMCESEAPRLAGGSQFIDTVNIEAEIERRVSDRAAAMERKFDELRQLVQKGGMVSGPAVHAPTEDEDPYADLDEVGDE